MKTTLFRTIVIKYLARKYGFRYRLKHLTNYGEWYVGTNLIAIDPYACHDDAGFISTLLHEIGHMVAYQNKKFYLYHRMGGFTCRTPTKDIATYIRTGLKAERYVDRWAEEVCKRDFPSVEYEQSYRTEREVEYFYYDNLRPFIEELAKRKAKFAQRSAGKGRPA